MTRRCTVAGFILTAIVAIGLAVSILCLATYRMEAPVPDARAIRDNERATFENILRIARAQALYRKRDWDGDVIHCHAHYIAHLWQTHDGAGRPVKARLIPKDIAFAMGPSRAVNGYYFRSMSTRESSAPVAGTGYQEQPPVELPQGAEQINYQRDWALVVTPAQYQVTGRLLFLADNRGGVFARYPAIAPVSYPSNPTEEGWTRIDNRSQLDRYIGGIDQSLISIRK